MFEAARQYPADFSGNSKCRHGPSAMRSLGSCRGATRRCSIVTLSDLNFVQPTSRIGRLVMVEVPNFGFRKRLAKYRHPLLPFGFTDHR